jgi:hypothetical protein
MARRIATNKNKIAGKKRKNCSIMNIRLVHYNHSYCLASILYPYCVTINMNQQQQSNSDCEAFGNQACDCGYCCADG